MSMKVRCNWSDGIQPHSQAIVMFLNNTVIYSRGMRIYFNKIVKCYNNMMTCFTNLLMMAYTMLTLPSYWYWTMLFNVSNINAIYTLLLSAAYMKRGEANSWNRLTILTAATVPRHLQYGLTLQIIVRKQLYSADSLSSPETIILWSTITSRSE